MLTKDCSTKWCSLGMLLAKDFIILSILFLTNDPEMHPAGSPDLDPDPETESELLRANGEAAAES